MTKEMWRIMLQKFHKWCFGYVPTISRSLTKAILVKPCMFEDKIQNYVFPNKATSNQLIWFWNLTKVKVWEKSLKPIHSLKFEKHFKRRRAQICKTNYKHMWALNLGNVNHRQNIIKLPTISIYSTMTQHQS